jgi:hypothetical protein
VCWLIGLVALLSCTTLLHPVLNPVLNPTLGFILLHAHEAGVAGNGQKMTKRRLSEVFFEKSTLKGSVVGKKIILEKFWWFVQF